MSRSTESPNVARDSLIKQALLILAIIVLGLGAIGARVGLRANAAAPEAMPLRASGVSTLQPHAQVHHVANSGEDVGPGESESDVANCPPAVR